MARFSIAFTSGRTGKQKGHPRVPFCYNEILGAADRNRTGDLRITNALLYRLSYSGNT
jgi:hypothetical protein